MNKICLFSKWLLLPALALALAGCQTHGSKDSPMDPPDAIGSATNPVAKLHIGDTVTIILTGLPTPIEPMDKPIKDDGKITLPDINDVQAAGRTPSELETEIHARYVPAYYKHLNVTVKASASTPRVYYVRGEVKRPDRFEYYGPTTVTRAIAAAQDFNDFANHKKVWLIRADGKQFLLNVDRIQAGKDPDPPVYPGDQIVVKRRYW